MWVWVWEDESDLTMHYHENGGAVAIAETFDEAVALVRALKYANPKWSPKSASFSAPLRRKETPQAWLMPNAGCC